jgi:hypothetical protein
MAPRDRVWSALQRPETWEGVAGVDRVHDPVIDHNGALRGFAFESVVAGKKYLGQAIPSGREEGRVIAWNIETSDVAGVITVSLNDANPGTQVDVSLYVESKGMLSGVFFPLISTTIGNGFPKSVENFAGGLD